MPVNHLIHGGTHTKLYGVWQAMKRRCYLKTTKDYQNYGARGITVTPEWIKDFVSFREWALLNGYKEGLEIDRIDNNGNYNHNNCRWVTKLENGRNRRNTLFLTIKGETRTVSEWCDMYGLIYKTVKTRMKLGWQGEELLIKAVKGRNQTFKKGCA